LQNCTTILLCLLREAIVHTGLLPLLPAAAAAAIAAAAAAAGDKLQLQGLCAFDAAVHCASMTTWPTSAGGSLHSKHAGSKTHWIRGLLQRLLTRIDLVGAAGLQSA
jgi:hypothetical protein